MYIQTRTYTCTCLHIVIYIYTHPPNQFNHVDLFLSRCVLEYAKEDASYIFLPKIQSIKELYEKLCRRHYFARHTHSNESILHVINKEFDDDDGNLILEHYMSFITDVAEENWTHLLMQAADTVMQTLFEVQPNGHVQVKVNSLGTHDNVYLITFVFLDMCICVWKHVC